MKCTNCENTGLVYRENPSAQSTVLRHELVHCSDCGAGKAARTRLVDEWDMYNAGRTFHQPEGVDPRDEE